MKELTQVEGAENILEADDYSDFSAFEDKEGENGAAASGGILQTNLFR